MAGNETTDHALRDEVIMLRAENDKLRRELEHKKEADEDYRRMLWQQQFGRDG